MYSFEVSLWIMFVCSIRWWLVSFVLLGVFLVVCRWNWERCIVGFVEWWKVYILLVWF